MTGNIQQFQFNERRLFNHPIHAGHTLCAEVMAADQQFFGSEVNVTFHTVRISFVGKAVGCECIFRGVVGFSTVGNKNAHCSASFCYLFRKSSLSLHTITYFFRFSMSSYKK